MARIYQFVFFGSGVIGNVYWYYQFKDSNEIHPDTRDLFITVLLVIALAGTAVFLLILPMPWAKEKEKRPEKPFKMLRKSLRLLFTSDLLLLSAFFCYDGLLMTFWTGVYGPSLSFSLSFETDNNALAGLHGIMAHTGCMLAGGALALLGHVHSLDVPRYVVVAFATLCNFVGFALIVLNVPGDAPLGVTEDEAFIDPGSTGMAISASLLLGIATGLMETQIMALVGSVYTGKETSHAFAVQKVVYHASKGISYGYAGYISLYWQIAILSGFAILGTGFFVKVDLETNRRRGKESLDEKPMADAKRASSV